MGGFYLAVTTAESCNRAWLSAKPAAICFRLTAATADVFSAAASLGFAAGLAFVGGATFAGALPSFAGGDDVLAAPAFAVPAIHVLSDSPRHETTTRKQKQQIAASRCQGGEAMAPRTTVTADTLVSLGAQRLAGILLDLAGEQPTIKRRLRLELAGQAGGEIIAAEISKRLTALRSARSFIDWQKRPDFLRDLNLTRTMIADRLAETRPDLALDLMWRFMALAEPTLNRVDDSSGSVGEVFRAACDDLGHLATRAN